MMGRALIPALLAALLLQQTGSAQGLQPGSPGEAALARIERLGPEAADEVYAVLFHRNAAFSLDRTGEARLIEVMRTWPTEPVVEGIVREANAGNLSEQLRVLRLLGELADAETVGVFFAQLQQIGPQDRQHAIVRRAIEEALATLLDREPGTYQVLRQHLEPLEPVLLASAARAVGRAGSGAGVSALRALVGEDRHVDLAVLEALAQLRPFDVRTLDGDPGDLISFHLNSPHNETRRQAVISIGHVRDGRTFGELIALLDDIDSRVQRSALWSLQEIAGVGYPADLDMWELHYDQELSWLSEDADVRIREVFDSDVAGAVEALRVLSSHSLFRRELTEAVAPALFDGDEVVVVATCAALQRLGDPAAVPALIDVLSDPREPVSRAALAALEGLTGERLGSDPDVWRQRVGL